MLPGLVLVGLRRGLVDELVSLLARAYTFQVHILAATTDRRSLVALPQTN